MQFHSCRTSGLPCGVPKKKQYTLVLDENGQTAKKVFKAEKQDCDNRPFSFAYPLPAYGVAVFQY